MTPKTRSGWLSGRRLASGGTSSRQIIDVYRVVMATVIEHLEAKFLDMVPMHGTKVVGLSLNQPTPDPSQEGSTHSRAPSQFPSWEGLGVGSWSQCSASKS